MNEIILNNQTAYLTGAVIGDGHLKKGVKSKTDLSKDYNILFDLSDTLFLKNIAEIMKSIIKTKTSIKRTKVRKNNLPRSNFQVRNKKLFLFLSQVLWKPRA